MKLIIAISALLVFICCKPKNDTYEWANNVTDEVKYDSHVHIMSPGLIADWKELGIPFSQSESRYANIDTILKYNKAKEIDLIGMSYVYGNSDYYAGEDAYQKMVAENDFLFATAGKYPNRITPFFSVDPLKDYAIEEFDRCYGINSQSGLKLHFSASQVYLTEPEHQFRVKPVFRKASEYKLPVLLHFDNWHPKFGQPDLEILMDSILSELDPMELRVAHFGTSGGFNDKTKRFVDAYVALRSQNRIPSKHRILFDISAVALDKDSEGVSRLNQQQFEELRDYIGKIGVKNVIFGTDYPLYHSDEYYKVLKEKVGLTKEEINQMMHQ